MGRALTHSRLVWLGLGLLAGAVIANVLPHTPLHAVATDRSENIVMATGFIDDQIEAVFLLDSLTGTLRAAVPSLRQGAEYQSIWLANAGADMVAAVRTINANIARAGGGKVAGARPEMQMPQTPKFMMVTGLMDIRQGSARMRPSRAVVYVAEANTGIVLTYVCPWSLQAHSSNQLVRIPMMLWAADQFATAVIREEN